MGRDREKPQRGACKQVLVRCLMTGRTGPVSGDAALIP